MSFTNQTRVGLSIFLLIHAGLHWALRNHPAINFNNAFSWVWIYGAAVPGALYLILQA